MIVTCENCATRFKFDEQRIKPQGIKVHCSRCRRTFLLMPPAGAAPPATGERARPEPEKRPVQEEQSAPAVEKTPAPVETATHDTAQPPLKAPDSAMVEFPELEDDPLADVPGFDPDAAPPAAARNASEEEKALEALTRDEQQESSVAAALDRFGASFDEPGGEGPEIAARESAEDGPSPPRELDPFDIAGLQDGFGEDDAAGGAGAEDGEFGADAFGGGETGESAGAPEDFDWEGVSFAKEREPLDLGSAETAEGPAEEGADGDDTFIESNAYDSSEPPAVEPNRADVAAAVPQRAPEPDSLELDLSSVARRPAPAPAAPAMPAARPAARAAAPAPAVESTRRESAAGPKKTKAVAIPPVRARARPERAVLAVPKLAGLLFSLSLGLLAAGAGAILAYAPYRGGTHIVRPAGEGGGRAPLVIANARGVTIDRLEGASVYLVTGTARWEGPSDGTAYLEGIITDPSGKVLERRPARLGDLPGWKTLAAADPDRYAPAEPLPAKGETRFSMLFTPAPTWRGEVRFELRRGR